MMATPSANQLPYVGPLLDHTEGAIMACDADWRVMVWNEGARRMFGWTAEEVVGQPATLLGLAATDGARMDRRRHLAEYGRWRGEMTVVRKDGTEVPVDASVVAIREAEARIIGYLVNPPRCQRGVLRHHLKRRRSPVSTGPGRWPAGAQDSG